MATEPDRSTSLPATSAAAGLPPADTGTPRLQLWFELFRDLAFISLALAGGVVTLLGTVFSEATRKPSAFISIIFFTIAAVACLVGQSYVVDLADKGRGPDAAMRRMRVIALVLLGAGSGGFMMFALRALGLYGGS